MRKYILLLGVALAISAVLFTLKPSPNPAQIQFQSFKKQFGKTYDSIAEESYRFTVFRQNLKLIESHNSNQKNTYKIGITNFADMTQSQFKNKILMNNLKHRTKLPIVKKLPKNISANPIDWRDANAITPVKNQGSCGSCWSFSVTGVLQSTYFLNKGTLPSFSQQQLVDCCGKKGFGCQGCSGAWPEDALDYINSAGIVSENSYPYKAKQGACQVQTGQKILNPTSPWVMLPEGDVNGLKKWIQSSPVSVCVDAANWSLYKTGVFSNCGTVDMNHAVLLAGIRSDDTWIVKNSWGASWGSSGYITLAAGNTCGIAVHAILPNF